MRAFHTRLHAVMDTAPVGVSALVAVANTAAADHRSRVVTVATSGRAFGAVATSAALLNMLQSSADESRRPQRARNMRKSFRALFLMFFDVSPDLQLLGSAVG